jgi:NAD(P)H-hydrate epimerase
METIELPGIAPRRSEAHKGDFGKVLVIAGSDCMIGAPALVATGAMRTGTGLCRIAAVKDILPQILALCPVATGFTINPRDIKSLVEFAELHDAVAIGPGMGSNSSTKKIVLELLERHRGPMVLDADALNTLSQLEASEWPTRRDWSNVVLTPHMGEFMRLMAAVAKRGGNIGMAAEKAPAATSAPRSLADDDPPSTADGVVLDMADEASAATAVETVVEPTPQNGPDRTALAELLSRATGCVVVLKGHQTVIADGGRIGINKTGNPGMATAGSGDVLTGVIASLIGQGGLSCAQAARLAAHLHGLAGDLAAKSIGPAGILATDIAEYLPRAIAAHAKK